MNAFRRAGWQIVAAAQADAVGDTPTGEGSAPVFRDTQQGRLLIGTKRLSVKFKPVISRKRMRNGACRTQA